ncbi:hypothetical protein ASPCAL06087 [Aspergillus calidoustus]|uniref:Uncharacterized protein n=1 Tax=Aspergillus calidoustus TaxID=454130 RepID=A0A0U4Z5G3_ASPCI|nr:hypothetical protein ASPCAL06087 [Aspergillus calidoustus]
MKGHTRVVLQSSLLKSAANLTAQLSRQYTDPAADAVINWQSVAEFAMFGLIQAHLNCHWQQFLEDSFPTHRRTKSLTATGEKAEKPIWRNVFAKLLLDQTLGLLVMNTIFLICTNPVVHFSTRPALILAEVNARIWTLIRNAWKIWPACALGNFLWVPVESRVLVASCVGFGWNIFLALVTMAK